MMKRIILMCVLAAVALFSAHAQDAVRGKVVDKHGNPIPGVKIETRNGKTSTVSGLDGTFSFRPGANYGYAQYGGFKRTFALMRNDMTIVMRPETWWNREPEKHSFFISLQTGVRMDAFGTPTAPSLGIMFGTVKRWGWYIRAISWLDSYSDFSGGLDERFQNAEGDDIAPGYWWTTGRSKKNHSVVAVGAVARLGCALHLYFGVGMALTQDRHELADGSWVATAPHIRVDSKNMETWMDIDDVPTGDGGFVGDVGLMLRMDFVTLNVGASYIGNPEFFSPADPSNWTLNAGVGFIF